MPATFGFMKVLVVIAVPVAIWGLTRNIYKIRHRRAEIKKWVKNSAQVQNLETVIDSEGNTGGLKLKYKHLYEGQEFYGNRVCIADGIDTVESGLASYYPDIYDELRAAQKNESCITIWVNPDDPSQSMVSNRQSRGFEYFLWAAVFLMLYILYFMFSHDSW